MWRNSGSFLVFGHNMGHFGVGSTKCDECPCCDQAPLLKRFHNFFYRLPPADQCQHLFHGRLNVMKKSLEARTKIIQPRLSIGRNGKTMFRATATTGKKEVAAAAISWKGGFLYGSKSNLFPGLHNLITDIAKAEIGIHEMITGINVTVAP